MYNLLQEEYGLQEITIEKLCGYDNANFLVQTDTTSFIFKTYVFSEALFDLVKAENEVLLFLKENGNNKQYPTPVSFKDGSYIKILQIDGNKQICRMLTYLDGVFLGDSTHTKPLLASIGTFLAKTDLLLQNVTNYTIKSRQWQWDIQYLPQFKHFIKDIPDATNRALVSYFFQQFEAHVTPQIPKLRKQIIYNDANEWNMLTKNNQVSAIIDFGDIAYSFLINELAIAITYACYDKDTPLDNAVIILQSYHDVIPLEEKEIQLLYYLIAARLCMSVCNSAQAKKNTPENTYALVSEQYAWKMLRKWVRINPIAAENRFREAAGFSSLEVPPVTQIVNKRHRYISPIVSLSYKQPIHMASAAFQYMYDTSGNTYLDAYNNIPHVGHSHPVVVNAGQQQMATLNTNTRYLYHQLADYAEKLLDKFPPSLNKVYFVNSGSAASDLAIRIAKIHTGQEKIMVLEHGYHGHTQTATDISDYKFNNPKGQGQKEYILKTGIPDTYRGIYKNDDGSAGIHYAEHAIELLKNTHTPIAAFISEPISGCGGQIPLAKGYLKTLYPEIRKQGGICICDEVQTGFGRLGDYFWGFEAHDVVPDMVVIGKPIANGHPMGAVICTDEIANSFGKGVEFFSSFGGNPVSCAIALSVLQVIEEEKLQENAKIVGKYYTSLFRKLQEKYRCIGDVRGSGLFLGIEIVHPQNQEPDTLLANHIKNHLRNRHILISTDGPYDNVLKTKPPLCFSKENAAEVVENIAEILQAYYKNVNKTNAF
ncbi:aminotransferase class III-fold pyridoxal phosphate-dependent enzyme [Aquimarina sp. TRL1]|uniref:aminotransferase class III-fold pyridoxal phosphate-dependent enzyme n=1 Tax=Aquimarina sp. (strain TRL1) TaxID=2736252 RepID=UPI00158D624A|nr:aminotransferase class III-fold pyridoxal phosphate-dependent enzyme [Aquimarina sp. TRL1]QKX06599.1 aminotransferase class III-fold pyridoxal phosphate-dependent enzyme [Aquimarina sp. TRL1]